MELALVFPKDIMELRCGTGFLLFMLLALEFSRMVLRRIPAGVEILLGGDTGSFDREVIGKNAIVAMRNGGD
jgi:hypothetical protein